MRPAVYRSVTETFRRPTMISLSLTEESNNMSVSRTFAMFALVLCVSGVASAAGHASDPDFFWLPPTVPAAPDFTGPFDATALDALSVVVCELAAGGGCVAGSPIEHFTSTGQPVPSRITLDSEREYYAVEW